MPKPSPWGPIQVSDNGSGISNVKTQILTDLARSIQQEQDAIFDYKERAKVAKDAGDTETVKLYEEITADEEDHFRLFTDRFHNLGGMP